nr:MAG TPA_asm: hypothetical protein [Caudoviricetes sp.]
MNMGAILISPYKSHQQQNVGNIRGRNSLLIVSVLMEVRFIYNVHN